MSQDSLARAVVADPRAVAERAVEPMVRSVAQLVQKITETPWRLGPADRTQAHAAGLSDEALFQVVLLSAFFGHLNRIADAVGVELDYAVALTPPHAEPTTPPYLRPEKEEWPTAGPQPLSVDLRPSVVAPLAAWRSHALLREAPLSQKQRAVIAHAVAVRLGDAATVREHDAAPLTQLDEALVAAADEVTLAPWRLGAETVARLRAAGLHDEPVIFDALATASACATFSRIYVALAALSR